MWHQNLTRQHFVFSPDGNFCACRIEVFGPSAIDIYVHSTGEYFQIDHPDYRDGPGSLDNDGTLRAASGIYKYQNGMYHWSTEGKEPPKGLEITKR